MTTGSISFSRSLVTTDVGKIRPGLGLDGVTGEHLLVNCLTIGWSIETASPCDRSVSPKEFMPNGS
jgi:hypothetical protein